MCSIPGLPTPGTEIPLLLTRVNLNPDFGLVELWVNMDDGMKHIYEQLRKEIQIPKRKLNGSEGKPGDLCLVCVTDTWHRARIVSIQSEIYNVFLIDQGQSHIATSETLAWGNSDSFLLPPEVESCILANVLFANSNWSEKASKFLKSLPGKKFKGLVQHVLMPQRTIVLDIPIVSRIMCKFGVAKNIPADEFKCFVLKCLNSPKKAASDDHIVQEQNVGFQLKKRDQYFQPELSTDVLENVAVTEIIDPSNIFCKLNIFSKALKVLSEQIHQHYEESSEFEDSQPQTCGDPCAAKGTNGKWHRSLLKHNTVTSSGAVEVLHVDEGKTEMVPVRDVRPLRRDFLRMPVVTYLCSLDGVKNDGTGWTRDQTDCLKALLLNQTVMSRFDHYSECHNVYYITLFAANAACLNNCFMEKIKLLPSCKSQRASDVPKATAAFLSSLEVGQRGNSENEDDDLQEEPLLSTKNPVLNGRIDAVSTSGAYKSSERSHALARNDGHLPAGFPNNCSANDIEVGEKEKVSVTSAENVHHFYCQLERDSHLLDKVVENINQLIAQPPSTEHPLGLDSICFARYSDGQWYRGQIVEVSPRLKVRFVDYGDTLVVNESDVRPVPSEPCIARSVPVLAVPLGLFDVPVEVPQEVNRWFAVRATDHSLTLSVVAKGTRGKLFVELFDGSLNVNAKVREKILKLTQQKMNGLDRQPDRRLSKGSGQGCGAHEDFITQEHETGQVLKTSTELNNLRDTEELLVSLESVSEADVENGDSAEDGEPLDAVITNEQTAETFRQSCHSDSETTRFPSQSETNVKFFKAPNICRDKSEEVYASWISGPHYFWCQFANTEDLNKLSRIAQEVGQAQQDLKPPETLGPGSPCLALSSIDNQWYRAQVIQRTVDTVNVLFVDYGEKSNVHVRDVRSLPVSLMEAAPQAFLCLLNGFDEAEGSWEDNVNDDFYSLLVDKPLRATVVNIRDYSEFAVPQYVVQIESGNVIVNDAMQKYWRAASPGRALTESPEGKNSLQRSRSKANTIVRNVSKVNGNISKYKKPEISKNQTEVVYASSIAEPGFFWCQYANTDGLSKVSMLAQEAGKAQKDAAFPDTLGPGCPCLALFSGDNQWYRVQVTQKDGDALHVLFVDFGNEADVNIEDVTSLPQALLELAPQAFLCSLHGFDETKGSWSDQVYDDFYGLLVDKPLRVTVVNIKDYSEFAVPQFAVEIECEGVVVNTLMEKYWKELDRAGTSDSVDQGESGL